MLIIYMGMYTALFPLTVRVGLFAAKEAPMPSKETLERFFRLQFSLQLFFWLLLYAIKFTFLILYRHIFNINKLFIKWWWAVFVYTWLAFWACFLLALWMCGSPTDLFMLSAHPTLARRGMMANFSKEKCLTPHASSVTNNYAEVGLSLNISSDLASKCLNSLGTAYILTDTSYDSPYVFSARLKDAADQENWRGVHILNRHDRRRYGCSPARYGRWRGGNK